MESEYILMMCCVNCLLLPSIVLQCCGFFSPHWINYTSKNITSACFRGILYNSGCPDDVNGLGAVSLGFIATSFAIVAFTTIAWIFCICCSRHDDDDNDDNDVWSIGSFGCGVGLYPGAGVFGFLGCIIVLVDFGDQEKGWAFYVSLAANCYIILKFVLGFCFLMYIDDGKSEESSEETGGQEVTPNGSNTSSGGMVTGQVLEHHQHHRIDIFSTGELVVRKLQFTRIFHISNKSNS